MTNTAHSLSRLAQRPSELIALLERPGPFLTLYLTLETSFEDPARHNRLSWHALRAGLGSVAVEVLDQLDELVADSPARGEGLAVIADDQEVLHVEHADQSFGTDLVRWASVPSIIPLLAHRQAQTPYVLVAADRRGADIIVAGRRILAEQTEGRDSPIRKVRQGGWSHRRMQQRAENTWRDNAANVAETLTPLVDEAQPRVIFVAGDVRAVELLEKALPRRVLDLVHVLDGGERAHGSADSGLEEEIARSLHTITAADTVALLRDFEQEIGQSDRAVNGPEPTIGALTRGQVDVLLVPADPDDTRTAWFGPSPLQIAGSSEELAALGVGEAREARLDDALVRAALGSGAGVRVVPKAGPISDGVGAILRWS